ncbi:MAG TPA: hypothetical protein VEJ63_17640 [Planctomycetota bacterium]|nr:hypothetical protein [Planctomycetota bacterium]
MRYASLLTAFLSFSLLAADAKPQTYALIVAGDGGEANFSENYKDWTVRLHKVLTERGIPASNIRVLMEKKDAAPICNDVSTRENVLKAFDELAKSLKTPDRFCLFFIGHGTAQNKTGKLCIPGPDISSDDVSAALEKLPAKSQLFVNSASLSDAYLEKCSLPGRIIITATNNPGEGNETYFMEFFLRGLETKAADGDKNGAIDALEAFNYAAVECPKWYLRQYLEKEGGWRVDGKQSRELWQKFYGKIPEKKLIAPADPNADDKDPLLGEWGPQWEGRRMPTEHAQLDDNGDKAGTAVFVNNEYLLVTPADENSDGFSAKKFIIGQQ